MGRKRLVLWCLAASFTGAGFCLGTATIVSAYLEIGSIDPRWQDVEPQTIPFLLLAILLIGCGICSFILARRAIVEEVFRTYFKPGTWEAIEAARRNGLQLVLLPTAPSEEWYETSKNRWAKANDAEIRLDPTMSTKDSYQWVNFLLPRLGDGFADSTLTSIVERDDIRDAIVLAKIMDVGDKGLRTAICLKDGLSQEVQDRCGLDEDADVREHFLKRYPSHQLSR
jgi:hypothetical protein